jgi:putative Ca2+/H+ antiporter (TMEM165/GDT1 family)
MKIFHGSEVNDKTFCVILLYALKMFPQTFAFGYEVVFFLFHICEHFFVLIVNNWRPRTKTNLQKRVSAKCKITSETCGCSIGARMMDSWV